MNEIVNTFLLVGDKFMLEMHLKQPGFTYLFFHLPQTKKELKILCTQETKILFIEMTLIKLVFRMIWLMLNQKFLQK